MSKKYSGPKVFVASGGQKRYDIPVHYYGKLSFDAAEFFDNPKSFRLVVLPGGEDIHPAFYGQIKHKSCGYTNYYRDGRDLYIVWVAARWGIPIVGICRGAQILNCVSHGSMIQHCDNHTFWHRIKTFDGRVFEVSSTHHQMMIPPKDAVHLGWSEPRQSTEYYVEEGKIPGPGVEPEVFYLPKLYALCCQYHPEYMGNQAPAVYYFNELIETKLDVHKLDRTRWDHFINLPKLAQTKIELGEEEKYLKTLTKKQQEQYWNEKYKEEYITQRTRDYRAALMSFRKAERKAESDYNALLKQLREQKKMEKEAAK